jgi:hypothetical protein
MAPITGDGSTYFLSSWRGYDQIGGYETLLESSAIRGPMMYTGLQSASQAEQYNFYLYIKLPGWGYHDAYQPTGTTYPDGMSYDVDGNPHPNGLVVIDFFEYLIPYYQNEVQTIIENSGYSDTIVAIGNNPKTDYPVYGGYGGQPPAKEGITYGFNMLSMERFTNSVYFNDHSGCLLKEHYIDQTATYTLPELATDIVNNHCQRTDQYPPVGYVQYLNVKNAELVAILHDYAESLLGRTLLNKCPFMDVTVNETPLASKPRFDLENDAPYYASNILNYLEAYVSFEWDNIGKLNDNPFRAPTQDELYDVFLKNLPIAADRQMLAEFDWDGTTINDYAYLLQPFGAILNRMEYVGGWFGREDGVRTLAIGALDAGVGPQLFTPSSQIVQIPRTDKWTWSQFPSLSGYDSIVVWDGARPNPSSAPPSVQDSIKTFVSNGGGLVVLNGWMDAFDEIFASEVAISDPAHPIFKPYNSVLQTVYEASYGSGKAIRMNAPQLVNLGFNNRQVILINNALRYVSNTETGIYWFPTYADQSFSDVYTSICGKPGGPILLWLSNRGSSAQTVTVRLDNNLLGLGESGTIYNARDQSTSSWSGSTYVEIQSTIPALSWNPLYIYGSS